MISAHALYEGTFSVGLDKKFIPMERTAKPAKGALRISINAFLIKGRERNYLFDAGLGEFGEGTSIQTLLQNLAKHGVADYQIDDIFISHLHYDHLGGLAHRTHGYWELTFPDAKLWVSKHEWEKVLDRDVYYDAEKTEFIHFLDARANLHFLDDSDQPYEDVFVEHIGGHTQYHLALFFEDGQHKFLQAGDVLPTKGHVNQKFAAKYDFDPKQSIAARQALAKRAFEEKIQILAYHSSQTPIFSLTSYDPKSGYTIEPQTSYLE